MKNTEIFKGLILSRDIPGELRTPRTLHLNTITPNVPNGEKYRHTEISTTAVEPTADTQTTPITIKRSSVISAGHTYLVTLDEHNRLSVHQQEDDGQSRAVFGMEALGFLQANAEIFLA